MKKKIIGILVCMLLIMTALPVAGIKTENDATSLDSSNSIWFVRGIFKQLDEDEGHIYLNVINARLYGIGNGVAWYHISGCQVKLSKPFKGIFTNNFLVVAIGTCVVWEYI